MKRRKPHMGILGLQRAGREMREFPGPTQVDLMTINILNTSDCGYRLHGRKKVVVGISAKTTSNLTSNDLKAFAEAARIVRQAGGRIVGRLELVKHRQHESLALYAEVSGLNKTDLELLRIGHFYARDRVDQFRKTRSSEARARSRQGKKKAPNGNSKLPMAV